MQSQQPEPPRGRAAPRCPLQPRPVLSTLVHACLLFVQSTAPDFSHLTRSRVPLAADGCLMDV